MLFRRHNFIRYGFKKIRQAYEAEANYNKDKMSKDFSNRTEFILTLKNLNYKKPMGEALNEALNEVLKEALSESENEILICLLKILK